MSNTQTKGARNGPPPPGMIVPRHGGGLLKPIQPGETRNPGGRGGEYHETVRLARQHSTAAIEKLIALMDSPDDRVALIAQQAVLERAWGKPKEYNPDEHARSVPFDVSQLSPRQTKALLVLLRPATHGSPATMAAEDAK